MPTTLAPIVGFIFLFFLFWFVRCVNILREYERAVVFRLGRVLRKEKGPGLVLIIWPIDKIVSESRFASSRGTCRRRT